MGSWESTVVQHDDLTCHGTFTFPSLGLVHPTRFGFISSTDTTYGRYLLTTITPRLFL